MVVEARAGVRTVSHVVESCGVRERIVERPLPVVSAIVRARRTNRGLVHVGDASVTVRDPGLEPGRALGLRGDPRLDLASVFIAAEFPGEAIEITYVQ